MAEVQFDAGLFSRHLTNIHHEWRNNLEKWGRVAAIFISTKEEPQNTSFPTPMTLFAYLFGWSLPDTELLLTRDKLWILTGPRKVSMIEAMLADPKCSVPVTTAVHKLEDSGNSSTSMLYASMWQFIAEQEGGTSQDAIQIGVLGQLVSGALASQPFPHRDITRNLAKLLVRKDSTEVKCLVTSGSISTAVLRSCALRLIENALDEDTHVLHSEISNSIVETFDDPARISSKLAGSLHVSCGIAPTIQSGRNCSLRESLYNTDPLQQTCILVELGSRFRSYYTIVGRTYLIDPPKQVTDVHQFTYHLQQHLISLCTPGTVMSSIYHKAKSLIDEAHPQLWPHFVENCGNSIGLENVENGWIFDATCEEVLTIDMAVTIRVGFANVELSDPEAKPQWQKYSILLTDTILVADSPRLLTNAASKLPDITYSLE